MNEDLSLSGKTERKLPKVSVYFIAGISTWASGNMFGHAMMDIAERYRRAGWDCIHTEDLYPYGTMDNIPREAVRKTVYRQMWHVFQDMYQQAEHSPRAAFLNRAVRKHYGSAGEGDIVLIGHSGGGIAAYLAARLLRKQGYPIRHVIQVGSPGGIIHSDWRDDVYCLRQAGWIGDMVTWWRFPFAGTASRRETVAIEGGHPFYFCPQTKDKAGVDNLSKVMDKIWSGIHGAAELVTAPMQPDISQG